MPVFTVLSILAIFVILAFIASRIDGLAFLAPKSTKRLRGAAQAFCLDQCRTTTGTCPIGVEPRQCPMWQFVDADMPTDTRVNPFRSLSGTPG
jgi:hypothetical protein